MSSNSSGHRPYKKTSKRSSGHSPKNSHTQSSGHGPKPHKKSSHQKTSYPEQPISAGQDIQNTQPPIDAQLKTNHSSTIRALIAEWDAMYKPPKLFFSSEETTLYMSYGRIWNIFRNYYPERVLAAMQKNSREIGFGEVKKIIDQYPSLDQSHSHLANLRWIIGLAVTLAPKQAFAFSANLLLVLCYICLNCENISDINLPILDPIFSEQEHYAKRHQYTYERIKTAFKALFDFCIIALLLPCALACNIFYMCLDSFLSLAQSLYQAACSVGQCLAKPFEAPQDDELSSNSSRSSSPSPSQR